MKENILAFAMAVSGIVLVGCLLILFVSMASTKKEQTQAELTHQNRIKAYEFCVTKATAAGVQEAEVQCLNKF